METVTGWAANGQWHSDLYPTNSHPSKHIDTRACPNLGPQWLAPAGGGGHNIEKEDGDELKGEMEKGKWRVVKTRTTLKISFCVQMSITPHKSSVHHVFQPIGGSRATPVDM